MKMFLVERDIGDAPTIDLMWMSTCSLRVAGEMLEVGDRIFYLGSTFLPADGVCLCLYTAKSREVVAEHSRAAHLPVRRISDVVTFGPTRAPAIGLSADLLPD